MISHPFEIKPSATNGQPDILMVTWRGTPALSVAEMYLPATSSKAVIAMADRIYGRHRLTATDANTIQFPASDLTLIPIPANTGRYAGLLSIDVRPSLAEGKNLTVSVRQLSHATATVRMPPPPPPAPKIAVVKAESATSDKATFSWRQLKGAFQYTVTVKSGNVLLPQQERLVAWLKWRVSVMPATNRWLPVLKRYLKYTESLVWNLGKDPNMIPPSKVGQVTAEGSGSHCPDGTHGMHGTHECTGKVMAIHYDRFGDFRGFVILSESGHERMYLANEHAIEELVREAWMQSTLVRVFSNEQDPERLDRLVLLRYH